jgi:UDP-N-acetylmuramoyl-tripeptide--D-alanyl-D-alanine ligase
MLPLNLADAAAVCGGRLVARDSSLVVSRVTTDSRSVRPGDLFIGLRGERFDGDHYAGEALAGGAVAVVVGSAAAAKLPVAAARIIVDDGLTALTALAIDARRRTRARVVAITGSAGKTSTKDILAALLRPVARTVATRGNLNNEIGVPLTVLDLAADTDVLVCELAMRGHGQIAELARIVTPHVAVITNIAPVHLELVGTVEDVAAAKAEIIGELGQGTLIIPADEPLLDPHASLHPGRRITFGGDRGDICIAGAERRGLMTRALVDAFGRRVALEFSFSGGHYLDDALAALGAFLALGFGLEEAREGAREVVFSDLRGELVELSDEGLLLNDAYNANPLSMTAALDHLATVAGDRPRLAFLGEMYELGPDEREFHRRVGAHAASLGVRVVAIGELAADYLEGGASGTWFATVDECLAALSGESGESAAPGVWTPGAAALVKASRALRLERVAAALVDLVGAAESDA